MSLKPGTKLGPYEITAPLGAGGMGEVYRATDSKLKREVAIKVLPEDVARDRERLARFEREAQLLASLNHPNIGAIYGLEESSGVPCLILELIEGETIAEMIKTGPLPMERALRIALQIAEALEAAHEKGIIHRDLKPANVKVTPDGTVKVLDFGLAKAFETESTPQSDDISLSPTLTMAATQAGVILGTAGYMSPEQAAGQPADRRSDIWSFGVVLMEMLAGRRLFTGETASHTLAAVLKDEPEWDRLPGDLPPRLRELLGACLRKKARHRLQAIGDARVLLEEYLADPKSFEIAVGPVAVTLEEGPAWKRYLPWAVAGLLAVALAVVVWAPWSGVTDPSEPLRLSIPSPENEFLFTGYGSSIVIAPDGSRIAYTTDSEVGRRLYLQFLDQWEAKQLVEDTGNDRPYHPFFSPDGQWLGYTTPRQLKKVPVRGGTPITLCEVEFSRGASWGPDGSIIFAPRPQGGLFRVAAAGGEPEPLTELDEEAGDVTHRWPQVLPGGEAVLFTSLGEGDDFDSANLELLDLATNERRVLHQGGSYGRYVDSGHVVYANQGSLFAFPFDLETLQATGSAAPVVEDVRSNKGQGGAHFDVSHGGRLLYASAGAGGSGTSVLWVDRQGNATPLWDEPQEYANLTISPDGTRLAMDIETESNLDVWVYDLERDVPTRLTFADGDDSNPVWSPDGEQIFFASERDGANRIYRKAADGSGEAELVLEDENQIAPMSLSPDGTRLAYAHAPAGTVNIWILPLDGGDPEMFVGTPAIEYGAKFSPDGRWLLYGSSESGSFEVYVRPAAGGRGKWQISTDAGTYPHWSKDGRTIFYRVNSGGVSSVQVDTDGGTFRARRPEPLFPGPFALTGDGNDRYDVAPDGERFIMLRAGEGRSESHEHLHVVLNWFDELDRTFATAGGTR